MSWIGIVFLYTFGGEILYGIRHDTFIDQSSCSTNHEFLDPVPSPQKNSSSPKKSHFSEAPELFIDQ